MRNQKKQPAESKEAAQKSPNEQENDFKRKRFFRIGPQCVKRLLDEESAQQLYFKTLDAIHKLDEDKQDVRRCFYDLICGDAYIPLGFKSEKKLFQTLCELSRLNRSTLYDYKNAALMEVELEIEHGLVSVDALTKLKENTTEESRKEIWPIVEQLCHFDEKRTIPTADMVMKAKKHHYHTSPEGKAKREAYINALYDDDELPAPNDQLTIETALQVIGKYSKDEFDMFSKIFSARNGVCKDASRILHELHKWELEEFKATYPTYYKISNAKSHDYSDEEIAQFETEYQEAFATCNDYSDAEIAQFETEYQEAFATCNDYSDAEIAQFETEYQEAFATCNDYSDAEIAQFETEYQEAFATCNDYSDAEIAQFETEYQEAFATCNDYSDAEIAQFETEYQEAFATCNDYSDEEIAQFETEYREAFATCNDYSDEEIAQFETEYQEAFATCIDYSDEEIAQFETEYREAFATCNDYSHEEIAQFETEYQEAFATCRLN